MTESAPRRGRWRIRWAERENIRRGTAYAAAIDQWRRRAADLHARRQAAASFSGQPGDGSLPVPLRRGELIYLTLTGVQSVEAPHTTALPAITWAVPGEAGAGPVPSGIRVRDQGTAVITSRRLLFLGPANNREWSYDKLAGLLDEPTAPMTLLQVSNRKTASGIVVQPGAAAAFRFHLQLAIADAAGQRAGLIAQLDQAVRDHDRLQPAPPALADPARAPIRAAWSPLRVVAAGVAAFVVLICVIGTLAPTPKTKPGTPADVAAADNTTAAAPALAARASSPGPTLTSPAPTRPATVPPSTVRPSTARPSTVRPSTVRPSTVRTTVRPTTRPPASKKPPAKPKPKPKPVDLCGAPANPLGYTFCGGSLIYSPDPSVCTYFDCIASFDDGVGYMIECNDGTYSMSGGRQGSCSYHGGNRRSVYH